MKNLKDMSSAELKQYLSANRNDEEVFSAVLGELMNRNRDTQWYSYDISPEEMEAIFREKINRTHQTD